MQPFWRTTHWAVAVRVGWGKLALLSLVAPSLHSSPLTPLPRITKGANTVGGDPVVSDPCTLANEWREKMSEEKERGWASASPVVLLGTAFLLFTIAPALIFPPTGPTASPTLFVWSFGAVIAIILSSLVEFRRGQLLLATTGMVFGVMLGVPFSASALLKAWGVINGMQNVQPFGFLPAEGFTWLAAAITLTGLLYPYGCLSAPLFFFVFLVDIAFVLLCLFSFGIVGPIAIPIAGWIIFVFAVFNALGGLIFFINEFMQRPVLSLGKPLFKPRT